MIAAIALAAAIYMTIVIWVRTVVCAGHAARCPIDVDLTTQGAIAAVAWAAFYFMHGLG